jgi:uncharacterized repeat protein (TIGR01451 family)
LQAATVQVINGDAGTGKGFDDPTPVSPVSGNPGRTKGAQRLNAFQAAADSWGALLQSGITITVDATMPEMACSANSGTLGAAGPRYVYSDFSNAPIADTWYPVALANSFANRDLAPDSADIRAEFNRLVDDDNYNCLYGLTWSYVIGAANPGGTVKFTNTVMHELAHGLGFISFIDEASGSYFNGLNDQFSRFLLDETPTPTLWSDLNNAGRAASATDDGQLTWAGPEVAKVAHTLNSGAHAISGRPRIYAPSTLDPGASVSHWDQIMSPSALMEPNANTTSDRLLTNHVMLDIGWKAQAAVSVLNTSSLSTVAAGTGLTYQVYFSNEGPGHLTITDALVSDMFPQGLTDVSWSCAGSGGGLCSESSGEGSIESLVTLPLNGTVTFTIDAKVRADFLGALSNTATITLPPNIKNTLASSATHSTTVTEPQNNGDLFHINPGLNGAWYNSETIGQGYFLEVYPDRNLVFFSMFTYDTSMPEYDSAQLGYEGHRWLTAQGSFNGDTAELDVYLTSGGLFDESTPIVNTPEGHISLKFQDCGNGTIDFNLSAADVSGSISIKRIANDNIPLCEEIVAQVNAEHTESLPESTQLPQSASSGEKQLSNPPLSINPGLSGAWFNPQTPGQGMFLDVYPDINLMFFSWFTYDISMPAEGATARLGYAGHRWLTAQGGFSGDTADLTVYLTTGGLFNSSMPVSNTEEGTVTIQFNDCVSGTLNYDFLGAGVSGSIPIARIANDNAALCGALSE